MPPLVKAAVLFMVAALVFYSCGVWSAFIGNRLRPWHVGLFWAGFLSDTAGTDLMRRMAGGFHWSFHTATGAVALLLMFVHAIWGTLVLINRGERSARTFHRASITVWTIWLIPFVTGMILGRHRAHQPLPRNGHHLTIAGGGRARAEAPRTIHEPEES